MNKIFIRSVAIFWVIFIYAGLRVCAESAAENSIRNKENFDDFEPVRLALESYINAVKQHEKRILIDIKSHNFSNFLGLDFISKIDKIRENYKRLFELHDRLKIEKIEVSEDSLLQTGSVPRDVFFKSSPGFQLDIKKLDEKRSVNNVKVSYKIVAHGDEDQKIWVDSKYSADFFFYKNNDSKWLLDSVIYKQNETAEFWTLNGRIADMESIDFNALATSWESLLTRQSAK